MKVPRDAQKPNPGPGAKYGSVYFVSQRVIPNLPMRESGTILTGSLLSRAYIYKAHERGNGLMVEQMIFNHNISGSIPGYLFCPPFLSLFYPYPSPPLSFFVFIFVFRIKIKKGGGQEGRK